MTVLIDSAESTLPKLDYKVKCSLHPKAKVAEGFGLAGGGYGTYTYCDICGKMLTKEQEPLE